MTRLDALQIARANFEARTAADIANLFHGGPAVEDIYGYRHGWYQVGDFMFSTEEITGRAYDPTQGGWAYL